MLPAQSPSPLAAAVGRGNGCDSGPVHPANDTTNRSPAVAGNNLEVIPRPSLTRLAGHRSKPSVVALMTSAITELQSHRNDPGSTDAPA